MNTQPTFPATVDGAVEQVNWIRSLLVKDRAAKGVIWRDLSAATAASFTVISRKFLNKLDR